MRKLISLLLLIAVLFNIAGYYFTFLIIQQGYKRDFITHLKNDASTKDVLLLRISDEEIRSGVSNFKWTEENEFVFQGKMYDVISRQKQGNMNIFRCLNDNREEMLMAKYEGIIKHKTDTALPYKQKGSRLYSQIVKEAAMEKWKYILFYTNISQINTQYSYSLTTFIVSPPEKPPQAYLI